MRWPLDRHSSPATRARSVHLQFALNLLAWTHLLAGELTTAALLLEEDRLVAEAAGNPPISYPEMVLAAWRGQEREASELIVATSREATAGGLGTVVNYAAYASSVLYNGLGRHDAAVTLPGKPSRATTWGTGLLSSPSWLRRRPGRVTWRSSGLHSSGCPNARV